MMPRKCIDRLEPYGYIPGDEEVARKYGLELSEVKRFDRNTSPYALKAVERELKAIAGGENINEYPDSKYPELTSLLTNYAGTRPGQIVLGNGADEVIDLVARAYLSPGDAAVCSTPTFSFYEIVVSISDGKFISVPREEDFSVDAGKLLESAEKNGAKIIFLCNPNNPTANFSPLEVVEKIAKDFSGVLVVDEAYIEFSGERSAAGLCGKYPNVVVIRTLSKAFGLAGMRIGYAICSEEVAAQLNKIRQPYNINPVSERLAIAALKNIPQIEENVKMLVGERERVAAELEKLGFRVFPSSANFLIIKSSVSDSERIFQRLLQRGIVLRKLGGELEGMLRITMRSKKDNNILLKELTGTFDGVIFDVDGVLVDVSSSYREAIMQAVRAVSEKEINADDIEAMKKLPGSNNDWDVAYALAENLDSLEGIDRSSKEYITVKEKFQGIYLGELRDKEKLIVKRETLSSLLRDGYKLGIATGRPREEALYALKQFIPDFFLRECIVALENCDTEKPDGKSLRLAKERVGCRWPLYVGDTLNDALAAKAAGMRFASVKEDLDADYCITDVNEIMEVLK